jgi:hypothetical protein
MRLLIRALAAAGLSLVASCAITPASRLVAPPDPVAVQSRLLQDEADTRTVRGLTRLAFEGPLGGGSGSQVVVVALPDRARVEALTPLGTTVLVATVRGDSLRAHSPVRREYWTGRATRETLGRLLNLPVPPELLLRVLAGLPPLPMRAGDPRFTTVSDGTTLRVESADGELWQRLWTEPSDPVVERGEVGRASEALLSFAFADRRPTDGRHFPFEIRLEEIATRTRLRVQYERVQLNRPADPDLFDLPSPTDPQTRIIDLNAPR